MKIGAVSDSHKNTTNLQKAFEYLRDVENIDLMIHLGDDYSDVSGLERFTIPFIGNRRVPILKVPGVYDPEYKDPAITNRMIKEYEGWKTLITHTPGSHENDLPQDVNPDLVSQSLGVKIILHGHTHIPSIEEKKNIFFINPGHLKEDDNRGYPPSFAVLDVSREEVQVKILSLNNHKEINQFSILSITE
ncbi:metallophosphoesterase family protein [Candidatus Margulisiibacteriota bacterium]